LDDGFKNEEQEHLELGQQEARQKGDGSSAVFTSVSPDVDFVRGTDGGDVSRIKAVLDHSVMAPGTMFQFRIMIVLTILVVFVEVDFKIVDDLHLG